MNPSFDEKCLEALGEHDPSAEERLVCAFAEPVKCALRSRLRRSQTVEDATQETLYRVLKYFRQGKTLKSPQNLFAFVSSVSTNVSLELIRLDSRCKQLDENTVDPADHRANPERVMLENDTRRIIHSILGKGRKTISECCGACSSRKRIRTNYVASYTRTATICASYSIERGGASRSSHGTPGNAGFSVPSGQVRVWHRCCGATGNAAQAAIVGWKS